MGNTMQTPDPSSFEQWLLPEMLDQLQSALEQMAQETQAYVLTQSAILVLKERQNRFVLVISPAFSALLQGRKLQAESIYRTQLTFDPEIIDQFVQTLLDRHPNAVWTNALQERRTELQPNQSDRQSQFTLKLIALLTMSAQCQSTELALRQQVEQERLLNQVTSQIRQSLELPVILQTAVEQVRSFLQVDRLVIYQLDIPAAGLIATATQLSEIQAPEIQKPEVQITKSGNVVAPNHGSVIYEARASEAIPSVMSLSDTYCFIQDQRLKTWQKLKVAVAIDDVQLQYDNIPWLLEFLNYVQVRAKLIAPLSLQGKLWGLLIAHECTQPRQWQENERQFLQQIAENLSIAISQAQLYAEVQQQKRTLEERVIERTQALRDAMLAAQSANRAKSEFLAAVSHELRTPLACIIGMSATLQRWTKDALTDRQQNFLQTIHESGEHLLTLINDILDLSQVETGRMVLNLQPISLSGVAQQVLKSFEGQAASQQIELELDLRLNSLHEPFVADSRRIQQILFNLLSNAVKFTSAGGKITLRIVAHEKSVMLKVKDTGIGIPEPQIPLLFQKFQQLDSSYHREYQGAGLGLALTKQLVELHGGWIEVKSEVGVGSTFTVILPIKDIQSVSRRTGEAEDIQKRGRVILVEPNEEVANLICDLLLAAGYQVVWVLEGAAVMDQIEVLRPLALILNIQLPDMEGYHLIHHLRQNPATQQLKILALVPTELSHAGSKPWQTATADDTLTQPIQPEALLQKLRLLVAREQSS